jgi:hypothetical protein
LQNPTESDLQTIYLSAMPVTWTTEEQLTFLKDELPGFRAAQRQQRGPQFLKGLAERWFEKWPERDELFFKAADAPAMALTLEEDKEVAAAVKKRMKVRYLMPKR